MIDANDKATVDLIGDAPKRRGRPATGKAKSGAERMREYRSRSSLRVVMAQESELSDAELFAALEMAFRRSHSIAFRDCIDELQRRFKSSQ